MLDPEQTRAVIAQLNIPDRIRYPELDGYTRDELYEDCQGGGGLYLAVRMARLLQMKPGDIVLDLGCGKGTTSIFLAKHYGVTVIALDLWTPAAFLDRKFSVRGYRDRIIPLNLDITQPLPFGDDYFDAVFCMNSFNFYGGNVEFLRHLLRHLKPGGQLCIGSEVLTREFTPEEIQNPPHVYAFHLPPPHEHVDVFQGDFIKQHSPGWWRDFFENSGLLHVEYCEHLDDVAVLFEEMLRHEYELNLDPFNVQMCLQQMEWDHHHEPKRSLFVICARKTG